MSRTVQVTVQRDAPYSTAGPPQRRHFIRNAIAAAVAGPEALEYGRRRWGSNYAAPIQHSAVGAVDPEDMVAPGARDDEFFPSVIEASVFGRLPFREVPFHVRLLRMTTSAKGYWVREGEAIPLSKPALDGSALRPGKVGALVLTTTEALENANPLAEARFEEDMRNALVGAWDEALLDPANTGTGEAPASITSDAATIVSTGDPATDAASLVGLFPGDLSRAVWVTSPAVAAGIGTARDAVGSFMFPNAGPAGGSILGLPLVTSRWAPDALILVDATGIAGRAEGLELARSRAAMIEANDDPQGDALNPTASSATLISLFQADLVAFRATIAASWEVQRPSVAIATGAAYVDMVTA